MLRLVGIPREQQVLAVGTRVEPTPERPRPWARRASGDLMDRRRCVILVPFSGSIMPPCERALGELERRGYTVRRVGGYAAIDQGRNQMATDALLDGFEETLWRAIASHVVSRTPKMAFGREAGLIELLYAGISR